MQYILTSCIASQLNLVFSVSFKEKAVLEGNLRPAPGESKGKRPTSVVIPKREEMKLGEKKATFEELNRKAEQVSINLSHKPVVVVFFASRQVIIISVLYLFHASERRGQKSVQRFIK